MRPCGPSLANINKTREVLGGRILLTGWISTGDSRRVLQGRVLGFTEKTNKRNRKNGDSGDDRDKASGD